MAALNTMLASQDFQDLVLEVSEHEGCSLSEAWRRATRLYPQLSGDVDGDTRYVPCRVVMFDQFSARELWEMTGGDNGR